MAGDDIALAAWYVDAAFPVAAYAIWLPNALAILRAAAQGP
jgi:hypothetical protein